MGEFVLPIGARNCRHSVWRPVGLGEFMAIAEKNAIGEPAPDAAENPVLQRVQQCNQIKYSSSTRASPQQSHWIPDNPVADGPLKCKRTQIQHRDVGAHSPYKDQVRFAARAHVGAEYPEEMGQRAKRSAPEWLGNQFEVRRLQRRVRRRRRRAVNYACAN